MNSSRLEALQSLCSALEVTGPSVRVDWMRIRESMFRILYDLPLGEAIALGCRVVRRYLPLFRVKHPDVEHIEGVLFSIQSSVKNGHPTRDILEALPFDKRGLGATSYQFLQAIDDLILAAIAGTTRPGLVAALLEWSIYCCILQRREDVWSADDPAAAAAAVEWQKLDELSMTSGARAEAHGYRARLAVVEEFLVGRNVDENIAAMAVEWREWRLVSDWLRELVTRHPEVNDMDGLEADFAQWRDAGGSWEVMAEERDLEQ